MNRKSLIWGTILVLAGIMSGLAALDLVTGLVSVAILGAGFLAAYIFAKRTLGFLIPGCVLAAVAVFAIVKVQFVAGLDGDAFLILLGLTFFIIFFVHTFRIEKEAWGARYWPLFPGISLVVLGILVTAIQNKWLNMDIRYLNLITPVMLVVIGIIIAVRGYKGKKRII